MNRNTSFVQANAAQNRLAANRMANKTKPRQRHEQSKDLCGYVHRICLQNRLEGFDYCIRHILEDKSAPFRPCSFIHPNSSKRCPNAARKTERRDSTLCPWHIKMLYIKRKQQQFNSVQIKSHIEDQQTQREQRKNMLKDLEYYCNKCDNSKEYNDDWVKQTDGSTTASDSLRLKIANHSLNMRESDTDEDASNPLIDETLRNDIIESDSEDLDTDLEEPLKHSGVYTAEEVSLILRDKMLRLQTLYIDQFKHLQFLLREKRKKYTHSSKLEKEFTGFDYKSSHDSKSNIREEFAKFKALYRYHRYNGKDALLKKQAKEKRKTSVDPTNYILPSFPTCIFPENGETCPIRTLPLSYYCKKHILYDEHQVLFRPCAAGSPPCLIPIVSFTPKNACILHVDLKTDKNILKNITNEDEPAQIGTSTAEPELFQTMDDIASLGLDAVTPGGLFGLDQFSDIGSQLPDNL